MSFQKLIGNVEKMFMVVTFARRLKIESTHGFPFMARYIELGKKNDLYKNIPI